MHNIAAGRDYWQKRKSSVLQDSVQRLFDHRTPSVSADPTAVSAIGKNAIGPHISAQSYRAALSATPLVPFDGSASGSSGPV
jgi:hypothetical protein